MNGAVILDTIKADAAELYARKETSVLVRLEGKRICEIRMDDQFGRALRVIKDHRIGMAHTNRIGSAADMALANHALRVAEYGSETHINFPDINPNGVVLACPVFETISAEHIVNLAVEFAQLLKDVQLKFGWSVIISSHRGQVSLSNSQGLHGDYIFARSSIVIAGLYTQFGDVLHYYREWSGSHLPAATELSELVNDDLLKYDSVCEIQSGTYTIIFSPLAVNTLLRALVIPMTGMNLVGKSSLLAQKLGTKILDTRFTLIDSPTCFADCPSHPFDDEGVITQSRHLVEHGVFKEGIHSLATANAANHKATGNGFRRTYDAMPRPKSTNLSVLPGNEYLRDLQETATNNTLYIIQLVNTSESSFKSGLISGVVMLGYILQGGERTACVKNVVISMNVIRAFSDDLVAISADRQLINGRLLPAIVCDGIPVVATT